MLLSVASTELEALLTTLQDLGVTTMDDPQFLQEQDLAAVLKPVQCRRMQSQNMVFEW